jgi:magnesium-transporting ATPase (P-type)
MVFIQNIHVLNCRSERKSVFKNGFRKNPFVLLTIVSSIILQIIVMEVPFLSDKLKTFNLGFFEMVILFVIALSILPVMESYKHLKSKK